MALSSSLACLRPSNFPLQFPNHAKPTNLSLLRFSRARTRVALEGNDQSATTTPLLVQEPQFSRVCFSLLSPCCFSFQLHNYPERSSFFFIEFC